MTDLFQIRGNEIPPLVGRSVFRKRIWDSLTKKSPDSLSIVAPYLTGKSVFLNWLVDRAKQEDSPFEFVLYWHLGRITPNSDQEFMEKLVDELRDVLGAKADQAGARKYLEDKKYKKLREVTDALSDEGKPILMVWDGFDKPLAKDLSVNLWDQIREIFYDKKHYIVTATRAPLVELIMSDSAATSPFWNIFDTHRLGIYGRDECQEIIDGVDGIEFEKGALTELLNWSGGVPIIALQFLNQLVADGHKGKISNDLVNGCADAVASKLSDFLTAIWKDVPTSCRDAFTRLQTDKVLKCSPRERETLVDRGLIREEADEAYSRVLTNHAAQSVGESGSLASLFDKFEDYKQNISELLERRLNQIVDADERLVELVRGGLRYLPKFPDYCLAGLTHIESRAFDMVWAHELENGDVPAEVQGYWTVDDERKKHRLVDRMMNSNDWKPPSSRLDQIRLLQLLTGCWKGFNSKSKSVSKDTFVMLQALHTFRNRNQHDGGEKMDLGVAVAGVMTAIELVARLADELK